MSAQPLIVYLHGFLSSPRSRKARQTLAYFQRSNIPGQLLIPALDKGPAATIRGLQELVQGHESIAFIGSSLGGFYATCMAERYAAAAVLINPAVRPHEYWQDYVGEQHNFHSGEPHTVTREHVQELQFLAPRVIANPDNYQIFLQQHDEVLDYQRALSLYGESRCIVRQDGDHGYENFHLELPQALQFLLSRISQSVR